MTARQNRCVLLNARPIGVPGPDFFDIVNRPVDSLQDGEFLVHTDTPMAAVRMTQTFRKTRATLGLIKEEGTGWDVGWASVFLASDEARWITGQTLHVDAGMTLQIPGGQTSAPPSG